MSFNNYGTVRAKTYLGAFANLTDLVVTGNATFSNLVYEREFINVSNTNVLNANIITVSDSLTLGVGSILDASNAVSISLGSNATATSLSVDTLTMNVGTANLFTVASNLSAANVSMDVGTANSLTVANITITNSLSIAGAFSPATVANSNLANIQSLSFVSALASRSTIKFPALFDTLANVVVSNVQIVESNPGKFVTYGSYAPTYSHLAGSAVPPVSSKLDGISGLSETFVQYLTLNIGMGLPNPEFQVGNVLAANILLHRNFTDGRLLSPAAVVSVAEPDGTIHNFANGYILKSNTVARNHPMRVVPALGNVNADSRFHSWSVSKGVGMMVAMCLYDKGYIKSLDDKISNYFSNVPTIGNNRLKVYEKDAVRSKIAAQDITVRHVLAERSGLIASSILGDGCSVPIRMTSDKKTYDISDFAIASNVAVKIAADSANLFIAKDPYLAGGLSFFGEPKAYFNDANVFYRAADWVQLWFDRQAANDMYLTANPGEVGTYSSTPQITTGLLEKIYQKATGTNKTYHDILDEVILTPIGLTKHDFTFYSNTNQISNVIIDTIGSTQIKGCVGNNFTNGLPAYATEMADYLTRPPLIGPFRALPNYLNQIDGSTLAYFDDGSRPQSMVNAAYAVATALILSPTPPPIFPPGGYAAYQAALADPTDPAKIAALAVFISGARSAVNSSVYPDLRSAVAANPFKFFDINSHWSATKETYLKIFSIISNNGYYIQAGQAPVKIISKNVIDGFFKRQDGENETVWPVIGQPVGVAAADSEGMYQISTRSKYRHAVVTQGRDIVAYNKDGAEIPTSLLSEYIDRSNVAVTGLANIYSKDSFTQLSNLYRDQWSNISEDSIYGTGRFNTDDIGELDLIFSEGAGGISIIMNRTHGITSFSWGPSGSVVFTNAGKAVTSLASELATGDLNTWQMPRLISSNIMNSPLRADEWVNRNTVVAKYAEPLLRANRLELYPVDGVAANVVALTTDTLSNLIVSNVNSYMFTVGPN